MPLTRRQREIFDFVAHHIDGKGYAPSFEEIAQQFGFQSLATVHEHLTNLERKGFSLSAEFYFIDGRTGLSLHKEKFTEEVLYGEEQKISPLSSYFELMDRLIPNFLGVISSQRVRGTRVLLR